MEFSDRDSRHNRKSMISKFSIFLSHSVDCWCGMWDMWWCWSHWQYSAVVGQGGVTWAHVQVDALPPSPVSSLWSRLQLKLIPQFPAGYKCIGLQSCSSCCKGVNQFRDQFHNWQYLEKVPTRAFSLKISIKWVHLTLRNLSSKIFAKWVLVSGLICEDLKTACQVNYRLTHCDKCQFIIVL